MTKKEACQRLELPLDATDADAKKAYFRLIRKYTPEKSPEQFAAIREAYEAFQQGFGHEETTDPLEQFPGPKNAAAKEWFQNAIQMANAGAAEKTVDHYMEVADMLEPDNPGILANWTVYYLNKDHPGKAVKTAERLIRVCPESGYAYRLHMLACFGRRWNKKAMDSGAAARRMGIHDEYFLKQYFDLLRQQDQDWDAVEIAPELLDEILKRKNPYQDALVFLTSWGNTLEYEYLDANPFFDRLLSFTESNAMRLSPSPVLSSLIRIVGNVTGSADHFGPKELRKVHAWLDILAKNISDRDYRKKIEECKIDSLGNAVSEDMRLDPAWTNCVGLLQGKFAKEDRDLIRFAEVDVQLLLIARWDNIFDQEKIIREEYPMIYEEMKDFLAELNATQDKQPMMDPRIREYRKAMKYMSGGSFEREFPELLHLPKEPEVIHSGWEGTYVREGAKIGRNDPCPCGSGKKYKNCCMNKGA